MDENNLSEILNVSIGGDNPKYQFYPLLKSRIKKAKSIDIVVAFLMESGVKLLLQDFHDAIDKNIPIRILTGNYLGITQPSALYLLRKEFGDQIEIKFYNEQNRSFHPKAYIIHYEKNSDILIGSSNLSKSALLDGIEWNYCFNSLVDSNSYYQFYNSFLDLYEHHGILVDDEVLKNYSKNWHFSLRKQKYLSINENQKISSQFEPRGAQIEALYALDQTKKEGATKALVMAATGIGKTYLAAFDSKNYKRVLFIAHREEILFQAATSFKNVRQSEDYGFFDGNTKCIDKSVIFASIATIGNKEYLNENYFSQDYFDYIVVDEFHHAVNDYYRNVMNYFKPKFLLGLTATPERMDGRNIYELCDYNVPYEIDLKEGINKGYLVPFHYYGIYDETDYSKLDIVRGRYNESELNTTYADNLQRYDLIYKYYIKHGSNKALGFCCSKEHARNMAEDFNKRNISSVAVYSGKDDYVTNRSEAIKKLKNGEIKVIFSVDMFNEGIDITDIDMVMFLRPTESPTVFMQQLGRGLRTSPGKDYLTVLDFIGNYEKAGRVRYLLTGRNSLKGTFSYTKKEDYPDDCWIDFDMKLIDLFERMDKKELNVKSMVRNEFYRIKEELGHRPNRLELFTMMDEVIYQILLTNNKHSPFKNYFKFLKENDELTLEEQRLLETKAIEFLNMIETTKMTKVYKMPVLQAFVNQDHLVQNLTNIDVLTSWKTFFNQNGNWKDFDSNMTYQKYLKMGDVEHIHKINTMPVKYLLASGKGFFIEKEGYILSLSNDLKDYLDDKVFVEHYQDIVEYRAMDYYKRRYDKSNEE